MRLGILAMAAAGASRIDGRGSFTGWEVGERINRRSSTLFRLRAKTASGDMARAYYKAYIPPPYPEERLRRWIETIGGGLERCMRLEERLAGLVGEGGIVFSRAVAVDPANLITVTMEVPGEPFAKPWRHMAPGARRRRAVGWLSLVGRAAELIERCSEPETAIDLAEPMRDAAVERRIDRARASLGSQLADHVESRMIELDRASMSEPSPVVYAHGDLSPTNILIGDGLGLIDFTWPAKVRGFDLAHLAFRLEYDTPAPASMTRPLVEALLAGYGDEHVTGKPGWRLIRLTKLLKIVDETGRRRDGRRRRALAEIEAI